ncbi:MAG: VPLPA-CTERM sorting domain-containing protein [Boseongicola sp.]|nr:VPLPA-CTERM sorting domain-containing protein [Boseongicola sp.]
MVNVKLIAATCLIAAAATSASAATYTFDLQKVGSYHGDGDAGEPVGNVLTLSQGGDNGNLTGTFTGKYIVDPMYAGTTLSGDVQNASSVQRHNNGLGVCNIGPCRAGGDAYHTVDGASSINSDPITDFVEISFSADSDPVDVTLKSLTFGWIGSIYNDYVGTTGLFEVLVSDLSETMIDAGAILADSGSMTASLGIVGGLNSYILPESPLLTDNLFGIKAGIGGSWKLMAVTVDYSVPEIPLPAAGWLLLAGIGSIAAIRRRKS